LVGATVLAVVVAVAPLLAGSVHRAPVTAVLSGVTLAFVALILGERLRGGRLRGSKASVPFALMALLPALQVLPFPTALRAHFDSAGVALLGNAPDGLPRQWPLSLDPLATRQEIAVAVATWMVFLLGLHLASGRRTRWLPLQLLALSGVVAVVSGLAHRIFDVPRLYGLFDASGTFPGPFINPNHAAEFYELTAFCALALAAGSEREVRWAWLGVTALEAAAALTTLSRGSFLALLSGGSVVALLLVRRAMRERRLEDEAALRAGDEAAFVERLHRARPRRTGWAWVGGALLVVGLGIAVAVALGATPVWDELVQTDLGGRAEKPQLWRDAWTLVQNHPWGIGRHAFEAVYPSVKTLPLALRFQFVENLPLQILIDVGWAGAAVLVVGVALLWRKITWRGDAVEAALIGGLTAVLAHNLVDFGLETLGMRLPFAVVAGLLVGRGYGGGDRRSGSGEGRRTRAYEVPRIWEACFLVAAAASLLFSLPAIWRDRPDEIWTRWHETSAREERHRLAEDGARRHPTVYFLPLLSSFDEPLLDGAHQRSPRLASLNRALRLCPSCSAVSRTSAAVLLALGRRSQALGALRDVVREEPGQLSSVLEDATAAGFRPNEIATLASGSAEDLVAVANFLIARRPGGTGTWADEVDEAVIGLLAEAPAHGVKESEALLVKATWASARRDYDTARTALARVKSLSPRDARPYAAMAEVESQLQHPEAALTEARTAVMLNPLDISFARTQVHLALQQKKWDEVDRALEQFKTALRQGGANVAEAHLLAAQSFEGRGNIGRALMEYHTVTLVDARNVDGWASLARLAEARGDWEGATHALERILALIPGDRATLEGLHRLSEEKMNARLQQLLPGSASH
jgi:tetratricopeptide (TPR) repeat protein